MPIHVPASSKGAFKNNTQNGGNVELPFAAPAFWVVNGDAKLAALNNFQFFGGFACSEKNLQDAAETWEDIVFPVPTLQKVDFSDDNGNAIPYYGARSLFVTIIGSREFSTIKDESGNVKRVAPFTKGGRPGIQVVAVLGYKDPISGQIYHWAPIMLTAKGYQVNHVKKAITDWRKAIEPVVKKVVPDADPRSISNLFWMSIGTFGKERKQEMVGVQVKKPITPVSAYIPEKIDEATIEKLYVGDVLSEWMADLSFQAQEWFDAFKKPAAVQQAQPEHDESTIPPEDDIPF